MDPATGIAYDDPAPNTFSFNSPYGACPHCNGLGEVQEITEEAVLPDRKLSISRGGIAPLGEYRDIWIFQQLQLILKKHKATLNTPIEKLPEELLKRLLHGISEDEADERQRPVHGGVRGHYSLPAPADGLGVGQHPGVDCSSTRRPRPAPSARATASKRKACTSRWTASTSASCR